MFRARAVSAVIGCLLGSCIAIAEPTPAPGQRITLTNSEVRIEINTSNLNIEVSQIHGNRRWRLCHPANRLLLETPSDYVANEFDRVNGDLVISNDDHTRAIGLSFENARKQFSKTGSRVQVSATWDLPSRGARLVVRAQFLFSLDRSTDELLTEVTSLVLPSGFHLVDLQFPRGAEASDEHGDLVWPLLSGFVLPMPAEVPIHVRLPANSRMLYMPWIGFAGSPAVQMILETPADAAIDLNYERDHTSSISAIWRGSLGQLQYPRRARFIFAVQSDHVKMAKRYRKAVKDSGRFVPFSEKVRRTPAAAEFEAGVVLRMHSLWINPETKQRELMNSYDDMERMVKEAKAEGFSHLVFHLGGWGRDGYDRLHPNPFPPNPESGGWDGIRKFADALEQLNYLLIIHDNYHMYNTATPGFDWKYAIHPWTGEPPFVTEWGAPQSILCECFALPYLEHNLSEWKSHEIHLGGVYLDEYGAVEPYESYPPGPIMTRRQSIQDRERMFSKLSQRGLVGTTEEPNDWAVPYITAPFWAFPPWMKDHWKWMKNPGRWAPLLQLVYSDSIIVPRPIDDPSDRRAAVLFGDIPLLMLPSPTHGKNVGFFDPEVVRRVKELRDSEAQVAGVEMLQHRFLDKDRHIQETTFANGVVIRMDYDTGKYSISSPAGNMEGKDQ